MRFLRLLQSGKKYIAILVIASIIFSITQPVFAAESTPAQQGADLCSVTGTIKTIFSGDVALAIQGCVVYALSVPVQILEFILHYELDTLIVVLNYQTHNNNWIIPAVYDTWYIIRNFINMGFIIVMIVMAIATVLSYEQYSYKKLLGPILITALIMNFSFTVGQNFIIFGNELAVTFAKQINLNNLGNLFIQSSGIYKLTTPEAATNAVFKNTPSPIFNALIGELFFIIYGIIAVLAIATVLVTSIIRIPALWIILITSPIAWIGYAVPQLKSNWNTWWKELVSWTFFLPIYMFCMIFAFGFLSAKATFNFGGQNGDALYGLNDIFFYIITLAALVGGLGMARSIGSSMGVGTIAGFDKVEKFFGVSQQQLQKRGQAIGNTVGFYATGGQYTRDKIAGLNKAKDARLNIIKEKGLFGIGGSEKSKLRQANVAEKYSGGLLKGTEDKAIMDAVGSNRTRISKLLESEKDDEAKKKFLLKNINSSDKMASQAARLEYAKKYNDISKINEDLNAVGGKDTAVGKELMDIYKKKLDDPKTTKDQKLEILKGDPNGPYAGLPKDFTKEVAKDLYEAGHITTEADYAKAKELFKDSEKELNALNKAIDKINPLLRIQNELITSRDSTLPPLSSDQERTAFIQEQSAVITEKLKEILKTKPPRDIADLDESFWKDENAQAALRSKMTDPNTGARFLSQLNKAMNSDRITQEKFNIFAAIRPNPTP